MEGHWITETIPDYIRTQTADRFALVIGNGIHRYPDASRDNDWIAMIRMLAEAHSVETNGHECHMASTELYDLIDLKPAKLSGVQTLQEQFCQPMKSWTAAPHHLGLVSWAQANEAPILTTNFDTVLADVVGARLHDMFQPRGLLKRPTDYYPWEKYFSMEPLTGPRDGFGIWHINGFINYRRSIKLGLRHYLFSVGRVRPWLRGLKEFDPRSDLEEPRWRGRNTWLDVIFNMPLVIFGLQLGAQEVFLRWLLIERARLFRRFPERRPLAWYIYPASEKSADDHAKYFFLDALGVKPVKVKDFEAIYGPSVWAS